MSNFFTFLADEPAQSDLLSEIKKNIPDELKNIISGISGDNANIFDLIARIIQFGFSIAGIIAVGFIVYGGIQYMIAGGQQEKTAQATKTITNAIIGLIIALGAIAIIYTIREATGISGNIGIQ